MWQELFSNSDLNYQNHSLVDGIILVNKSISIDYRLRQSCPPTWPLCRQVETQTTQCRKLVVVRCT